MKRTHYIGNSAGERFWIWFFRFGIVLCVAMILGLCGSMLYLTYGKPMVRHTHIIVLLEILALGIVDIGLLDATRRNGWYSVGEDGITEKNMLFKNTIRWKNVFSWEIRPVRIRCFGPEREYIVLYLSERQPRRRLDLTWCNIHRKELFIILGSPERVEEIRRAFPNGREPENGAVS